MENEDCGSMVHKTPGTLKDVLVLMALVNDASTSGKGRAVKHSVCYWYYEDANMRFGDADKFYKLNEGDKEKDPEWGHGSGGYMWKVFEAAEKILKAIVKDYEETKRVSKFSGHIEHFGCVTAALKNSMPRLYSALYYLYFMTSEDYSVMGGGTWSSEKVNNNGIKTFLTSEDEKPNKDPPISTFGILPGGFSSRELHGSKTGKDIASAISNIITHDNPGDLQKVMCYILQLILVKWHDSLTGHAALFLQEFCKQLTGNSDSKFENVFKERYSKGFGELKTLCEQLKENLRQFVNGSNCCLKPVCHNNSSLYSRLVISDHLPHYLYWLKHNLQHLMASLENMSKESSQWNRDLLQNATSAGPFKYSFVFTSEWKNGNFCQKLQDCISKLTGQDSGPLEKLKDYLDKLFSRTSPGANAARATTGLLGAAGLGAGAAYVTNAFGFKDIVLGFIATFLG